MIEILGEYNIYKLPDFLASITNPKDIPKFPSPEFLRRKYIIKCKAPKIRPNIEYLETEIELVKESSEFRTMKTGLLTEDSQIVDKKE